MATTRAQQNEILVAFHRLNGIASLGQLSEATGFTVNGLSQRIGNGAWTHGLIERTPNSPTHGHEQRYRLTRDGERAAEVVANNRR